MNAKKCKALRSMVPFCKEAAYHIPPLVPVFAYELGLDGKPTKKPVVHHFKTATVTLGQCGRKMYRAMKRAYKGVKSI